jgi:thiol-disulfide isomerase/thioredoxin
MPIRAVIFVGLWSVAAGFAQAAPREPRDLLTRSEAALRSLRGVCYEAHVEVNGILATQVPQMQGTVTLECSTGDQPPRVAIDCQITPPRQPPVHVRMASDGQAVAFLDYAQRLYRRADLAMGLPTLMRTAGPLLVQEFVGPPVFERELRAVSLEYRGTEPVGDVECDVIHAVLAAEGGEVRWYLARSDHLPRRVTRFVETPMGMASIQTSLTALDARPALGAAVFQLDKPEGFSDTPEPQGPAGRQLLAVGSEAPDWTLKTSDGKEVSLKSLRGKYVLMDFWATWCGPCKMAMPGVQKFHEKYKDKPVAVLGVNCWERSGDPAAYMKDKGFTYPLLLKADEVAARYKVTGIPTFYLIGPDGKVLLAYSGASEHNLRQADELVAKALAGTAAAAGEVAKTP